LLHENTTPIHERGGVHGEDRSPVRGSGSDFTREARRPKTSIIEHRDGEEGAAGDPPPPIPARLRLGAGFRRKPNSPRWSPASSRPATSPGWPAAGNGRRVRGAARRARRRRPAGAHRQ
jgi:hypothetical protein